MTATLYEPPRKPLVSRRFVLVVIVVLTLAGLGASLYRRHPGWLDKAATGFLGLFGYELASIEVMTTPTRADILLDGERKTEIPFHVRRDGAEHRVSAIAPGFETAEISFRADGDKQLFLSLRPARRR